MFKSKAGSKLLHYLEYQLKEAENILIYKPKKAVGHRYRTSSGDVQIVGEVQDQSELLRGKLMVLKDIISIPEILQLERNRELAELAKRNAKLNKEQRENGI